MPARPHQSASGRSRLALAARAIAEPLELRMLLSISPAGPEFRVNTYTSDLQNLASVAMDGDGDFVIAWESAGTVGQDGSGYGVFAQRYNAVGVPQGSEFQVNTYTTGAQKYSSVAMDADGDFVIAWSSSGQDGDGFGVYAQRYNAVGVRQGSEFRVNTYTTAWQTGSSIAMNAAGNFVITWDSVQDGSVEGIYAQRYDAAGVPQGGEFRVNTYTSLAQIEPSAAMDGDGDFVVTWNSLGQDGSDWGVYAQRFNASGLPQGGEFRVNTFTTNTEFIGSAAMDANGDFVVAWDSFAQDGSLIGVYAQRYNAAGVPQGSEFRANTYTTNTQEFASVAMDADGDFVITWSSYGQDGSGFGVYSQNYNSAGVPQGAEFRANSTTANFQTRSAVARDPEGDFVIAWSSRLQDGSNYGIYAQRYEESIDLAPPVVGGVFVNGERVAPYTVHSPSLDQIVVSFSENVSDAGGPTGTNSVTNPANWLLTRNGADVTASISSITYGFNVTTNRYEAALNLSTSYTTGNFLLMAKDNIRDLAGNQLDGNLDGASGGNMLRPFSIAAIAASGPEFRVNSYTTSHQDFSAIAIDADGDFVIAWHSSG